MSSLFWAVRYIKFTYELKLWLSSKHSRTGLPVAGSVVVPLSKASLISSSFRGKKSCSIYCAYIRNLLPKKFNCLIFASFIGTLLRLSIASVSYCKSKSFELTLLSSYMTRRLPVWLTGSRVCSRCCKDSQSSFGKTDIGHEPIYVMLAPPLSPS